MSSRQVVQNKRDEIRQKQLASRLLKIFQADPNYNFSPEDLVKGLGQDNPIEVNLLLKFLRHFIDQGNIRNIQLENGKNCYRYVPDYLSDKFCRLSEEQHLIYQLIEEAGQRGIWRGDLKRRTNTEEKHLAALLKELRDRSLIKEVASVTDKKKTYFLYDIDPPTEVTGGIWFSGPNFNSELVDQVIPQVVSFVVNSPGITVRELRKKVKTSGIHNLPIGDEEAEQLVDAAISSGEVFKKKEALRPGPAKPVVSPITKTACKGCPLAEMCEPDGAYNPAECVYLAKTTEYY